MAKPQQPELHRSGHTAADPASTKTSAEVAGAPESGGATGPIPVDNLPGHHPEHEQDKPEGPPRVGTRPRRTSAKQTNLTTQIEIPVGDMTFRALASGPPDGEIVLLLHGFPQTSAAWRPQLTALAKAGYRVIAPDQRGYSPGARLPRASDYRLDKLTGDVFGMAEALDADGFHLVGHDWGGIVAWAAAAAKPERVFTLSVLSTPHPRAYLDALPRSVQGLRSLYIGLFALPMVPEFLLGAGGGAGLRRMLAGSGLPSDSVETYTRAMSEPGALSAALNWYRALRPGLARGVGPVNVPTLYIWSDGDVALGRAAATATGRYVTGEYRFEVMEGVSHWIPELEPDRVSELLLEQVSIDRPASRQARAR